MASQPGEFLLIDIGNSFTKIARSSADRLGKVHRIPTPHLDSDSLRRVVGRGRFVRCVLSSVVPDRNHAVERLCDGARLIVVGPDTDLGVRIDLPAPITTGADRLANAAFAAGSGTLPAVVVDLGSAATFDVVTRDRGFIGGAIAPGLEVMASYFHDRTALLPKIDLRDPKTAIGRTTVDAMLAGAVHGYRGLVRGILAEIRREVAPRRRLAVLATGGYAAPIAERLPEIHQVHPNLTLEGLRLIGRRDH
jgi:type III pantothenate kinase